jgi:hypothetical protein
VKLQREADERVEAARRRAEEEVAAKVDRARSDALAGAVPDESPDELEATPGEAAEGEPRGTRYVGGRRLRTF